MARSWLQLYFCEMEGCQQSVSSRRPTKIMENTSQYNVMILMFNSFFLTMKEEKRAGRELGGYTTIYSTCTCNVRIVTLTSTISLSRSLGTTLSFSAKTTATRLTQLYIYMSRQCWFHIGYWSISAPKKEWEGIKLGRKSIHTLIIKRQTNEAKTDNIQCCFNPFTALFLFPNYHKHTVAKSWILFSNNMNHH